LRGTLKVPRNWMINGITIAQGYNVAK
jgi:hypothetical protein